MLTWDYIVRRVKNELVFPYNFIERTDQEIIDYLKDTVLREFSMYFPSQGRMSLDLSDPNNLVPGQTNEFYLVEPEGREILTVKTLIPSMAGMMVFGHPILGPWSYGQIPNYLMATNQANDSYVFQSFEKKIELIPPNILRVTPMLDAGMCTVEYEKILILEEIYPTLEQYFVDMCIGKAGVWILKLRSMYENVETPFGKISPNTDKLSSDFEQLYNQTLEKIKGATIPNIIITRG